MMVMMMKHNNNLVLVASTVLLVCLCIHHANSKPLTEQHQEFPSSSFVSTGAEVEYETGLDLLRRITRQADPSNGNNKMCKYKKGSWSACDPQTKVRTRTFTLKRGDRAVCEEQKTIRKECKGKKEGGKKNKARDNGNNNQQPKNNRERDRPRKKNNHNNN